MNLIRIKTETETGICSVGSLVFLFICKSLDRLPALRRIIMFISRTLYRATSMFVSRCVPYSEHVCVRLSI